MFEQMAVLAVCREPLSVPLSLFIRQNTGKITQTAAPGQI